MSSATGTPAARLVPAFEFAAQVIEGIPYGQPIAALLRLIAAQIQANESYKALCGSLPDEVYHFAEKLSKLKAALAKESDCPWRADILERFEAQLKEVQKTLQGGQKLSWFKVSKSKAKLQACSKNLVAINKQLDDAVIVYIAGCMNQLTQGVSRIGSLSNLRDTVPVQDAPVDGQVVADAMDLAALVRDSLPSVQAVLRLPLLLMEEIDVNKDGQLTVQELWDNCNIRKLISNRDVLGSLVHKLFDKDKNGSLDYKETVVLAAALQQISKLFYAIPTRCPDDSDFVPSSQVVALLQQLGYQQITGLDVELVADTHRAWFKWDVCGGAAGAQSSCSYEGFVHVYFFVVDKYNLWDHAKSRIGQK